MLNLHEVRTRRGLLEVFEDFARQPISEFQRNFVADVMLSRESVYSILRDLERAAYAYRAVRPNPRLSLLLTAQEYYLIRSHLELDEFTSIFGPEGARLNYRGVPLTITDERFR